VPQERASDIGSEGFVMTAVGTEATATTTETLGTVLVLLVDDDEVWARVTGRLLEENNDAFEVTIADSLQEGRTAFDRLDPDCVVCDYQLGDGTGLALLETVRAADADRPFLLVTGRGSESVASEAIGQGVTDYIRKDQDDDEAGLLASRITNAVSAYDTERALERERRSKAALIEILTGTTAETELSQEVCAQLVSEHGYTCAWLGRENASGVGRPRAVEGRESYLDAIHAPDESLPPTEPARQALDRDESVRTRIDENQPDTQAAGDAWHARARKHGFEGAIAVPVRHEGVRLGVLAVYADDAALISADEQMLIEEYAETVGYALRSAERKRSLMTPRRVDIQVKLDADAVPLGVLVDAVADEGAVELLSTVLRDDGTTLYVTELDRFALSTVENEVATTDGVRVATVDQSVTPARCELIATVPTPEERLAAHGVVVETTTVTGGSVTLSLSVPDNGTIPTIQDVLAAEFEDPNVSTIWGNQQTAPPTTGREFLAAMTDRQREVLHHALDVGYFERPRGISATELADHFGVTRATVSQHLRTAQRKVFSRLFSGRDPD
jgi:predicted DNA binding protein/ActR/RegA family two-component response regulator